jgi:hypothetical protein
MALLDLQGMESESSKSRRKSGASKGCSGLSLLLCG